jgi:hypothetical protein
MNNSQKLTKAFFESDNISEDGKSESITLDNFDQAILILKEGSKTEIEVENEHGTRFPTSDLSNDETNIFLTVL